MTTTANLPAIETTRRILGVNRRPAWPAASDNARCHSAEAAPAPAKKATPSATPLSDKDAVTDPK